MSYALDFAPDEHSKWRELDAELQERVLDVADQVADNPPPPPVEELIRDFVQEGPAVDHLVFVRVVLDHRRRRVVVTGVVDLPHPRGAQ